MNSTKSWEVEMDKMLDVFERQANESIAIMKTSTSLQFNLDFKKYFMFHSNKRIEDVYDKFQIDLLKQQINDVPKADVWYVAMNPIGMERTRDELSPTHVDDFTDNENSAGLSSSTPREDQVKVSEQNGIDLASSSTMELNETASSRLTVNQSTSTYTSVLKGRSLTINLTRLKPDVIEYYNRDKGCVKEEPNITQKMEEIHDDIPIVVVENNQWASPPIEQHVNCNTKNGHDTTTNQCLPLGSNVSVNAVKKKSKPKKRFNCAVCEYSTDHKNKFTCHVRTHSGEKPYECDHCEKRFARRYDLKNHSVIHDFPFHCKGCFRGFSLMIQKVTHERKCQKLPYQCYVCKLITNKKISLEEHMRSHTGEKPFHCEICLVPYRYKNSLNFHWKNIHNANGK